MSFGQQYMVFQTTGTCCGPYFGNLPFCELTIPSRSLPEVRGVTRRSAVLSESQPRTEHRQRTASGVIVIFRVTKCMFHSSADREVPFAVQHGTGKVIRGGVPVAPTACKKPLLGSPSKLST